MQRVQEEEPRTGHTPPPPYTLVDQQNSGNNNNNNNNNNNSVRYISKILDVFVTRYSVSVLYSYTHYTLFIVFKNKIPPFYPLTRFNNNITLKIITRLPSFLPPPIF